MAKNKVSKDEKALIALRELVQAQAKEIKTRGLYIAELSRRIRAAVHVLDEAASSINGAIVVLGRERCK